MIDRDRETLAMPHWQEAIAKLGDKPVVLRTMCRRGGKPYRHCASHYRLYVHGVKFLIRTGILVKQSESPGVAVYVRAVPPEPKAAWLGGIY